MLTKLWRDIDGAVVSAEVVLVGTILGIGVLTGASSLRDSVITELADLGGAVSSLHQGFEVGGSEAHSSQSAGTLFVDFVDFCDDAQATTSERCLVICNSGSGEQRPSSSPGGGDRLRGGGTGPPTQPPTN